MAHPIRLLRRLLRHGLAPLRDPRPASRLIRQTARKEWKILSFSMLCNLLQAAAEGATLGVVFLAVDLLSKPAGQTIDWTSKGFLGSVPQLTAGLNALPRNELFLLLLGLAVLLKLLQSVAMYLGSVGMGYYGARTSSRLQAMIHSFILSLSFPCSSRYRVGDLLFVGGSGPGAVMTEIKAVSGLVLTILMAITYLVVLLTLSPWLLVAALIMGGILALVQQQILPRLRSYSFLGTELNRELSSRITENIQGLRLLHTSGQLDQADRDVLSRSISIEANSRAASRVASITGPVTIFLPILMIAAIAGLSLLLFSNRNSGILPSLVTFVLALQRLNGSFGNISGALGSLNANAAPLDLLNKLLEPSDKEFRSRGGIPFQELRQGIALRNVSLQYTPDLPPALSGIDLDLPRGSTVALVGSSGAGKSSIADLLCGLYTTNQGEILIDNTPLEQIDLISWQQRLGVVSQDTFLFNASIADNISFGTPNATRAQILAAAEKAQAAGFISDLPKGFDTLIGERGYRLSGGQRQRLSLARAILRDPELLILDEATSALDTKSERLVQQAIDQFERQFTVLVIAHRLSTIVKADLICVLDKGQIVEQGNHQQLLEKQGIYSGLWKQQTLEKQAKIEAPSIP
ncbi:ABC transporter ATP-binding protein/permease [Cyanobium sp. FGCU-52]|nr:ABC transporter ATP-binding protein/permease [Cyanobium sp. FGCU52]